MLCSWKFLFPALTIVSTLLATPVDLICAGVTGWASTVCVLSLQSTIFTTTHITWSMNWWWSTAYVFKPVCRRIALAVKQAGPSSCTLQ